MKTKSLLRPLLLAASLFTILPASATVTSPLVLKFVYYAQVSEDVDENDILRGEVQSARLDSKGLLKLLAIETGMIFPKGAKLMVDPDGGTFVADKNGDFIVDTSDFLTAIYGPSLFDGFFNLDTEHEKSNILFTFTLILDLDDEELFLEMAGMAKEKFNASKPNNNGVQKLKGNISVDLSGQGSLEEELILGEGTATLKGKETVEMKK